MSTPADQLLEMLSKSSEYQMGMNKQIAVSSGEQADIEEAAATRNTAAANAAAANAVTAGKGLLAAQDATQATKTAFDFDATDPNSRKRQAIALYNSSYDKAQALLDQIGEKKSINFLDDPLGYMGAQLTIHDDIAAYNTVATKGNMAFATVRDVDSTLTAAAQMEKATAKTINNDSIANDALIASNQFAELASQAAYNAVGSNINQFKALISGDATATKLAMDQFQVIKSDQMLEIQQKQFDLHKKQVELMLSEHADKDTALKIDAGMIVKGMALSKVPLPEGDEAKARFQALLKTPAGKQLYQTYYQLGLDATAQEMSGAPLRFGANAGDVFYNEATTKGNFANSEYANQMNYINSIRSVQPPPTVNTKNPEEVKKWITAKVAADMKEWSADAEAHLLTKAPTPAEIGLNPAVAATPFFKEVMAASAAAKGLGPTPSEAFSAGMDAVKAGKMTASELSYGMQQYYETAVNMNTRKNYFAAIPGQDGYKAKIAGTGIFKDSSYDLTKVEQVNRAIADTITLPIRQGRFGLPFAPRTTQDVIENAFPTE